MIDHRLILECDAKGCHAILVSGRLVHHGSAGDARALEASAVEMGWFRKPAGDQDRTDGPWHYCPEHSPQKEERS